jgi:hypothetical protein
MNVWNHLGDIPAKKSIYYPTNPNLIIRVEYLESGKVHSVLVDYKEPQPEKKQTSTNVLKYVDEIQ